MRRRTREMVLIFAVSLFSSWALISTCLLLEFLPK